MKYWIPLLPNNQQGFHAEGNPTLDPLDSIRLVEIAKMSESSKYVSNLLGSKVIYILEKKNLRTSCIALFSSCFCRFADFSFNSDLV